MFLLQFFPDKFVRRDIDALEMYCPYRDSGCDWEGTFAKLKVRKLAFLWNIQVGEWMVMKIGRPSQFTDRIPCSL